MPLLKIEIDKIKRCRPWPMKAKKKEEVPVMAFIIEYLVEKDGKEKEKSVIFRLASFSEVISTVESVRKAMIFYAEGNRPKLFKPAAPTKISHLITSNTPAHGRMERRVGKSSWRPGHFSIIQDTLYTFKSEKSRTPLELTPLHNTDCKRRVELFQERRYSFAIVGPEKTLFFAVETEAELGNCIRWLRERQYANPPRFKFDFVAAPKENGAKDMRESVAA